MKTNNKLFRIQLIVLVSLFSKVMVSQQISIPDTEFEKALIEKGYDLALDGYLEKQNVENVKYLYLPNKNISNIKGVEAFVNLIQINVNYNNISNIDILSNLKSLGYILARNNKIFAVSLGYMPQLKKLSLGQNKLNYINLKGFPNLSFLSVPNNNLLFLPFDKNKKIEYLDIKGNNLSNVNIENLLEIRSFYATSNNIKNIDFSKNTKLEYIDVQGNLIEEINLSNSPNLKHATFKDNNLNYLNIKNGNNNSLSYFTAVDNPDLRCIVTDRSFYLNGVPWWFYRDKGVVLTSDDLCGKKPEKIKVVLFPLPFNNRLSIISTIDFERFELYNHYGYKVKSGAILNNRINVYGLPNAIYILKLYHQKGVYSQKVVKTNNIDKPYEYELTKITFN